MSACDPWLTLAASDDGKKGVIWVKPKLAVEIAFRGWTHDEKLRRASFKGVRETVDEAAAYRLGCCTLSTHNQHSADQIAAERRTAFSEFDGQ